MFSSSPSFSSLSHINSTFSLQVGELIVDDDGNSTYFMRGVSSLIIQLPMDPSELLSPFCILLFRQSFEFNFKSFFEGRLEMALSIGYGV